MKKCIVFLCFIFLTYVLAFSQTFTISGKVIDANTGLPLAYANVWLQGSNFGTITNISGEFLFHFNSDNPTDTICVTLLGYKPYKIPVSNIINRTSKFYITLTPVVYNIKEVKVRPLEIDAYEIVKRAKDSMEKYAMKQPHILNAYYREYIRENQKFARAVEAAVSIYHEGQLHIGDAFYPVRVLGVRSSEDYLSNFTKTGNYNQLSLFLTSNLDYKWFFMNMKETKFTFDSIAFYDKKLVYVISGEHSKCRKKTYSRNTTVFNAVTGKTEKKKIKQVHNVVKNTDFYFRVVFYIQKDDYRILKMQYSDTLYKPLLNEKFKHNGLLISINATHKNIDFMEYQGKYFPKYISESKNIGYYKNKDSALFINVIKYTDLMINSIETEKVKPIYAEEQPRIFSDLYNQKFVYDEKFWKKYNYIPDDDLRSEVLRDIEISRGEALASMDNSKQVADTVIDTVAVQVNKDLIFRVQIMALKENLPVTHPVFKGIKGVYKYFHEGKYKYTLGETHHLEEAMELLPQIRALGFKDAFIVPFYMDKRITIDEAVKIYSGQE